MSHKTIFFGVDSYLIATESRAVHGNKTLYDYVVQTKDTPDFWGRYIGGANDKNKLTRKEASELLSKGCMILPIYNKIRHTGGKAEGLEDAKNAIKAALELKMPENVYIYANIESHWKPTVPWILGWCEGMFRSVYGGAGGFYCNPSIWGYFRYRYADAIKEAAKGKLMPHLAHYTKLFVLGPSKGCQAKWSDLNFAEAFRHPDNPNGTVLWQYAINCDKRGKHGLYDQILAIERGLHTLWRP